MFIRIFLELLEYYWISRIFNNGHPPAIFAALLAMAAILDLYWILWVLSHGQLSLPVFFSVFCLTPDLIGQ